MVFIKQLLLLIIVLFPLFYLIYRIRDRKIYDVLIFFVLILIYILINRFFIFGKQFVFHDTMWTYQVFYSVIHQWLKEGFSIGWNPFMNGGEPLFIYSNYFLSAELIVFSLLNRVFNLPFPQLVNLYFTYIFISYFVFCFILFSIIFKKRSVVFFPTAVLIFSGFTYSSMGAPTFVALYLLPLALTSLYLFFIKQDIGYLLWSAFFLCISANHYLPQYLAIFLLFFIVAWYLAMLIPKAKIKITLNGIRHLIDNLKTRKKIVISILIFSLFVLLPAAYVSFEIRNYISPTRGFAGIGQIKKFSNLNVQPAVNLTFDKYIYLLRMPMVNPNSHLSQNLKYNHSVYYIGFIPLIFFSLSFFYIRTSLFKNKFYFSCILTLFILMYFSLGSNSLLWKLFNNYVPMFYLRHSFPFSNIICLLIIVISTFGFSETIKTEKLRYLFILIVFISSYTVIGKVTKYNNEELFDLKPFKYPKERKLYLQTSTPIPFDTAPLILKEASATNREADFIFLIKKPYHKLLQENPEYVTGNLFIFSKDLNTLKNISEIPVNYALDTDPNHIKIKVTVPEEGYLIRKENFNKGWKAKVDNVKIPILKFMDTFQAIKVPKGNLTVDFAFSSAYPVFLWLHVVFVFLGYIIFFRHIISD